MKGDTTKFVCQKDFQDFKDAIRLEIQPIREFYKLEKERSEKVSWAAKGIIRILKFLLLVLSVVIAVFEILKRR